MKPHPTRIPIKSDAANILDFSFVVHPIVQKAAQKDVCMQNTLQ